jgi:hypothetical protein
METRDPPPGTTPAVVKARRSNNMFMKRTDKGKERKGKEGSESARMDVVFGSAAGRRLCTLVGGDGGSRRGKMVSFFGNSPLQSLLATRRATRLN